MRNIIRTRLVFLSTLSLRRATQVHRYRLKNHHYFYPRSPCGERLTVFSIFQVVIIFLSTLSLRRATVYLASQTFDIDISIHALLAESDAGLKLVKANTRISIHALLAESDVKNARACLDIVISIHALLAESDTTTMACKADSFKFLSTLSLRRATREHLNNGFYFEYFYPRSPCGERRHYTQRI